MTKTLESIQNFLEYHNVHIKDVKNREFQVLASPEGGEPVDGKRNTWTDGYEEWRHIRVPHKADTDPTYTDRELEWNLSKRALAIGFTGWDWVNKQSLDVGFDIDSLTNHAEGVGLSDEDLAIVREKLRELPYVTIKRSTSGNGLHAVVALEDGVETANHNEHAAVARAIMGVMSTECNFDFTSAVDCCGQVLWCWKSDQAENAFEVIKEAERKFKVSELPANWKANLEVLTRERGKVKLDGVDGEDENIFAQFANGQRRVELSDTHKSHLKTLAGYGSVVTWVADHHLVQGHTAMFKRLHTEQGLKGIFETVSQGNDLSTPNVFAIPAENDSWVVVRFGRSVREKSTWKVNKNGWVTCKLNVDPTFGQAMEHAGGQPLGSDTGYAYPTVTLAMAAMQKFGVETPDTPFPLSERECSVFMDKNNNIIVQADKEKSDKGGPFSGWNTQMKKTKWSRLFRTNLQAEEEKHDLESVAIRASFPGAPPRYLDPESLNPITEVELSGRLQILGVDKKDVIEAKGQFSYLGRDIVTEPWAGKYPRPRAINPYGSKLDYPVTIANGDDYSAYDSILKHHGAGLDPLVKASNMCKEIGISDGKEYLIEWIRTGFRNPSQRSPGLCIYSRHQNNGKSTLQRALSICSDSGCVNAEIVLMEKFNKLICGIPFPYFEDFSTKKLDGARDFFNRLIESPTLTHREHHSDARPIPNFSRPLFSTNKLNYLQLYVGDTRWSCYELPKLETSVPWPTLKKELHQQASAFLHFIFSEPLRDPVDRLSPPPLESELKQRMVRATNPIGEIVDHVICEYIGETKSNEEWFSLMPNGAFSTKAVMGKAFKAKGLKDLEKDGWEVPADYSLGA